jgi:hypothetical protein
MVKSEGGLLDGCHNGLYSKIVKVFKLVYSEWSTIFQMCKTEIIKTQ